VVACHLTATIHTSAVEAALPLAVIRNILRIPLIGIKVTLFIAVMQRFLVQLFQLSTLVDPIVSILLLVLLLLVVVILVAISLLVLILIVLLIILAAVLNQVVTAIVVQEITQDNGSPFSLLGQNRTTIEPLQTLA